LVFLIVPCSDLCNVFDHAGAEVIETIPVGDGPRELAYNLDNGYMYVVNIDSDTISVIDENNEVVESITVGDNPQFIAHNGENGIMYVTNFSSDTVSVIGVVAPPEPPLKDIIASGNNLNILI